MPKATLTFNLPEEQEEHQYALNGISYSIVIEELDNWLRNMAKYEDKNEVGVDEVRSKIRELMNDRDLK